MYLFQLVMIIGESDIARGAHVQPQALALHHTPLVAFDDARHLLRQCWRFAAHPKWLVVAIFIVGDADVNQSRHDDQQRKHTRHQRQIPTPSNSKYSFSSYFLHLNYSDK